MTKHKKRSKTQKPKAIVKPVEVEHSANVKPQSVLLVPDVEMKADSPNGNHIDSIPETEKKPALEVAQSSMPEEVTETLTHMRAPSLSYSDTCPVETVSSTDDVTASSTLPEVLVVDSLTTSVTSSTSDDSTAVVGQLPTAEVKTTVIDTTVMDLDETEKKPESAIEETPRTIKPSVLKLKYDYRPDQWSPVNPTGSKNYDRSFLLNMRFSSECMVKPMGMSHVPEILLDKPLSVLAVRSQSASYSNMHDFTPNFVSHYAPNSGSKDVTPYSKQRDVGSEGGGWIRGNGGRNQGFSGNSNGYNEYRVDKHSAAHTQPTERVIEVFNRNVQLNKADNAWKPTGKNIEETELLYKQVRSILNKITPQKLDMLIDKVMALKIDTEDRLKGVIDILFEKAISEPNFCPAYAQLAFKMINVQVPSSSGDLVSFRKLLLNRCQTEFEKDSEDELACARRELQIDSTKKDDEKKQIMEKLEIAAFDSRRRSLGNVRFIAELFKLKILTEAIMHGCIHKLLRSSDEDSLEFLCRLLTNSGKDLSKNAKLMEKYFVSIKQMTQDKKKYAARIRFMLQDVTELRDNNWVPRRADNNPKTIEQIHREAEEEKREKENMIRNILAMPRQCFTTNRPMDRGSVDHKPISPEDEWTTVSCGARNNKVDPKKILKIVGKKMDENVTLGPSQRPGGNWAAGSRGGGFNKPQPKDQFPPPSNRFAALEAKEGSNDGRQNNASFGGRSFPVRGQEPQKLSPTRSGYNNTGRFNALCLNSNRESQGGNMKGSGENNNKENHTDNQLASRIRGERDQPRPLRSDSRSDTRSELQLTSSRGGSLAGSRGSSCEPTAQNAIEPSIALSDSVSRKVEGTVKEYLSEHNVEEALLCIDELKLTTNLHSAMVTCIFNYVFENTRALDDRKLIAELFGKLLDHENIITTYMFLKGLKDIVTIVPDLLVDIPKAWEYLSDILCPLIVSHVLELDQVSEACAELENSKDAGVLLAHTMQRCALEQKILKLFMNYPNLSVHIIQDLSSVVSHLCRINRNQGRHNTHPTYKIHQRYEDEKCSRLK